MLRLDYYRVYSEQVHECNIYEELIYRYLFLTLVIDKLTLSKYVNILVGTLSIKRAVVVAQLVERLRPTPEICSSSPEIGKILSTNSTIEKDKNNEKDAGNGPSLKNL